MSNTIHELQQKQQEAINAAQQLVDATGETPLDETQRNQFDEIERQVKGFHDQIETEKRREKLNARKAEITLDPRVEAAAAQSPQTSDPKSPPPGAVFSSSSYSKVSPG